MRAEVFALPLMLVTGAVSAQTISTVEVEEFARGPQRFVGKPIRIVAARCVNEPKGKYACRADRNNVLVQVEGLSLDFRTSVDTRRKLSGQCRTPLVSAPESCTFAAEFKPLSFRTTRSEDRTSKTTIYVKVRRLDLF